MPLLFEVQDYIATITLNRPEAMNSIDPETRAELHDAWQRIKRDGVIRVAILTGAGEMAFCTGSDLKRPIPTKEIIAELTIGRTESDHQPASLYSDNTIE